VPQGLTVAEAIAALKGQGVLTGQQTQLEVGPPRLSLLLLPLQVDLLVADLNDNYRLFNLWEGMLHQPIMFSEQLVFQLDPATASQLVEQYYALDSAVVREILGRKLSGRMRKDLDEVSERTGVSLRSCRRQFDNLKRVHRAVEEIQGVFLGNIRTQFLLPELLAEKYSVLVFVACHRFETNKKKLAFLTFEDFSVVCKEVMARWTPDGQQVDESGEPVLDKDFFYNLRDLKLLAEKEKEHRYAVCQSLGKQGLAQKAMSEIEANFKTLNKNLLNIGQGLYSSKEVKELFVNAVDKVVEPVRQCRLSPEELGLFLATYSRVVAEGTVSLEPGLRTSFERFMATMSVIVTVFHRAATANRAAI
jgi:hypothetical protein